MCILSENIVCLYSIVFCFVSHTYFVCMVDFETCGNFIHRKCDTKHQNYWKYKFHPHQKRLCLPIYKFCYRWRFDQVFLASKYCLEVLVTAVFIWPKSILDEIISMKLVHVLYIEFFYSCGDGESQQDI